ncbi:cadherin-repeats domain-containing protein [Ixodes scapularis]|uniref:Cadherin-repeats domain-containing protein n=1 Tax=Ixodes scapularis TaxID=6945 RepID=B7QHB6_IXOSC|nr:cadherin-repeats domain-containing protein [Ixodes scapularis]|eukprot:XP_002414573.1 cadherin-repeats domain-containing protein [Ixodes scapularis]
MDNSLRYALAKVEVSVMDINDNVPVFDYDMYNITVMENLPPGFTVVQVHAVDRDSGDNADFLYHLIDDTGGFTIDEKEGWIRVRDPAKLDREKVDKLTMRVLALERKPNVNPDAKASTAVVEVSLLDANDNNPQFLPEGVYIFSVTETDPPGTVIGSVVAVDPDMGENGRVVFFKQNDTLSYSVPFGVHPFNGSVYVLDRFKDIPVKPDRYTFFVVASDAARSEHERRTAVAVVHVNVTDVNNNVPEFVGAPYEAQVGESLPAGALVTQVSAKDLDANTALTYSIIAGNDDETFHMNPFTGVITSGTVLDFEKKQSYDLLVQVSDGFNTAVSPLTVHVVDINDQQPVFTHNYYNFSVVEEMTENVTVGTIRAIDRDSGRNAAIRYTILGDHANNALLVDEGGNIVTKRSLDRERESKLEFLVIAFDGGIPQLSGTTTVAVQVEDINDNPPYFEGDTFFVNVPEEKDPPLEVFTLQAKDVDSGDNAVMKYRIIGGNDDAVFGINEDTGVVTTSKRLNYETQAEYALQVAAFNVRPFQGPQAATMGNPVDVNDELVTFEQTSYNFRIWENTTRSESVGFLNATNQHQTSGSQHVTFWIGEGNDLGKFWINPSTGELVLMDKVDRDPPDSQVQFRLKVFARDLQSITPYNTSVPVIIDVLDINDNAPSFGEEKFALELPESLPLGTELPAFYRARDIDAGPNGQIVRFMTEGAEDKFFVNNVTGALTLISELDYETADTHEFVVLAMDGGTPPKTGSASIIISVQNINEFSPEFVGYPYNFYVAENAARGTSVGQIQATDKDGNKIVYAISDGDAEYFGIESDTGKLYVKKNLESRTSYTIVVTATDNGVPENRTLGVQVTVFVKEVNNYPPVFSHSSYKGTVLEKYATDRVIIKLFATDKDLQNNTITYNITSGNDEGIFVIDHETGDIRVNPETINLLDYDRKKQFVMLVQAKDSHNTPLFGLSMVTIDVLDSNDHAPTFSKTAYSASLPENLPSGHCFLSIQASSGDSVDQVTYEILNKDIPFTVNGRTGDVCTSQVLDRERRDSYEFAVAASDGKFDMKAPVSIEVVDENDNPPRFEKERYSVSIPHDSQAGRSVIQLHAIDLDVANNGEITYWIKNTHGIFEIDAKTGLVRMAAGLPLNSMKNLTYEMEVFAQDHGAASNIGKTSLVVKVSSTHNNPPVFDRFAYSVYVDENAANVPLVQVHASDPDEGSAGKVVYRIARATKRETFRIDSQTGKITLVSPLDYEQIKHLEVFVEARDDANEPQFATTIVQVTVNDVNDNAPEFLSMPRLLRIPESTSQNELVYRVQAIDLDSPAGGNNDIKFELNPPSTRFSIHPKTGQVFATQPLQLGTESLRIVATDGSIYPLTSAVEMRIEVYKDSVDEPSPAFSSVQYTVDSASVIEAGATVLEARATVPNGSPIWYNITGDDGSHVRRFSINHDSGRIVTTTRLDAEKQSVYHFMVVAVNKRDPQHQAEAGVVIRLTDKNVRCPKFPFTEYFASIQENSPPDTVVLPNLIAEDVEKFEKISYQITEDNSDDNFVLDTKQNVISLRVKKPLDRDNMPAILQGVTASNYKCSGSSRIKVYVEDVNDNSPVFEKNDYVVELEENTPPGQTVTHLMAADRDGLDLGKIRYYIIDGNSGEEFSMDETSGIISVRLIPDREKTPAFMLKVLAVDSANNTVSCLLVSSQVAIVIQDVNDSPPQFEKEAYYEFVSENAPVGTIVDTVKATDPDSPQNTNMTYSFARLSRRVPFMIDPILGTVNITRALDISESQEYSLEVQANDGLWKTTTAMKIYVSEAEERDPRFDQLHYKFKVLENVPGAVVGQVELQSRTLRVNSQMRYSIINTDVRPYFNITKAKIFTKVGLDREKRSRYTFTVMLEEKRPTTKVSVSEVSVEVVDVNDETPTFMQSYQGTIRENSPPGTLVTVTPSIMAIDKDSGNNSVVHYSLGGSGSDLFSILDSGVVIFSGGNPVSVLDRELADRYELLVTARDLGNLSSTTYLTIKVEDENDNAPSFQHGPLRVLLPETARPGARVAQVSAIDADEKGPNSKVEYSIVSGSRGNVRIDRQTGEIFVVGALKPETVYLLNVSAADGRGLANLIVVNITVLDVNDHKPTFVKPEYSFTILEGNYKEQRSRLGVLRAVDDDRGKNGAVDYAIISRKDQNLPFHVDVHTGELFATGVLDRETKFNYYFHVLALDNGDPPQNSTVNVTVTIEDANDEKPRFFTDPYLAQIPENLDPGQKVTQIRAFDPDTGENGLVFYKLGGGHDNKFYIDSKDGTVWTLSKLDFEKQEFYNMTVIAYDQGKPSMSAMAKLWVTVTDRNDVVPEFPKSVYTLEVAENTRVGDVVYTLDAGPGNFLYTLDNPQEVDTFSVEPHNGEIRLAKALDSIHQSHYRLVVSATDDGDPPKSDHAEVNIIIGSGQGVRLFPLRMYDVLVFENQLAPQVVLDLNATDEIAHRPVQYTIVGNNYNGLFAIEPDTGRLSVTSSLDREAMSKYVVKVRAMNKKRVGRAVRDNAAKRNKKPEEDTAHVAFDEALVVVNVGDENDNSPVFDHQGKPIVAAVPLEASFGYQVTKLHARDADTGFNGAIRYEIIQKAEDASSKFQIDPVTGVVRSVVTFSLDGGKMYGFDVKAVDREGSEGGNAAVANVFKTWEQQRLYSIKNPLMGKAVGNPYGGRVSAGPPPIGVPPPNLQYNNVDDVPMDYNDSMTDTYSVNKHNKMKLRQTAPDGASSLNPPRSPRFERYAKNENGWYDNRDVETVKSDMTGSNFTSWSSRRSHQSQSRGKPVTEL